MSSTVHQVSLYYTNKYIETVHGMLELSDGG